MRAATLRFKIAYSSDLNWTDNPRKCSNKCAKADDLYWPPVKYKCLGDEKVGSCVRFQDGMAEYKRCRLPLHSLLQLLMLPWPPRRPTLTLRRRRGGTGGGHWSELDDDRVAHVVGCVDTRAGQVAPRAASHESRKRTASFRPAESICAGQDVVFIWILPRYVLY